MKHTNEYGKFIPEILSAEVKRVFGMAILRQAQFEEGQKYRISLGTPALQEVTLTLISREQLPENIGLQERTKIF